MTYWPGDWHRVRVVLETVLDHAPAERAEVIERCCGDDDALRASVEAFLRYTRSDDVRASESAAPSDACTDVEFEPMIGRVLGRYRIVEMVAHGGMGVVFRAQRDDGEFEKDVAVKVVRHGVLNARLSRRFHQERQTLARLDHPYITHLLDGGTTDDGQPYLVMEYVSGLRIDEYCNRKGLSIADRLGLFRKVCEAVHFAHQNLIVHRDLKPSNILVTEEGIPKLLDFGVSTLSEAGVMDGSAGESATVVRALTPYYCSPEQIRGEPITTASDVYSLGLVLCELVTGLLPHDVCMRWESPYAAGLQESEPDAPSALLKKRIATQGCHGVRLRRAGRARFRCGLSPGNLARRLSGDLDAIILKALRAGARDRYDSVLVLSEDLGRHLKCLPVSAHRGTLGYRAQKFARRHKAPVAAACVACLGLTVGGMGLATGLMRAREAERIALQERNAVTQAHQDAQKTITILQDLMAFTNPYRKARDISVLELLEEATSRIDREFGKEERIEAAVRLAIGKTYAGLWRWQDAIPHAERALELYRGLNGSVDHRVADCLGILGRALTFAQNPKCVAFQQEALRIRRALEGETHPLVAESRGNLAYAYWHGSPDPPAGLWDLAADHYAAAIDIYKSHGSALTLRDRRDQARMTFSFGVLRRAQRRFAEAEPLFRDALDLYRRIGGSDDRYMIECLDKYAGMLEEQGRNDEAEALLKEALDGTPRTIPDPRLVESNWRLGDLRWVHDDFVGAERYYRQAIAERCRYLARTGAIHDEALNRIANQLVEVKPGAGPITEAYGLFAMLGIPGDQRARLECRRLVACFSHTDPVTAADLEDVHRPVEMAAVSVPRPVRPR